MEDSQEETKESNNTFQMKTKAEKAYQEILSILSDPENSVPKRVLGQITSRVMKLQILFQRSLIYSSNLEGCIIALQNNTQLQQRTLKSAVEKTQRQPVKLNMIYAECVGVAIWNCGNYQNKERSPNAITIVPANQGVASSSDKTKEAVLRIVSLVAEKFKVNHVKKISGNGILVETADQKDFATLLENKKLRKAGFVVGVPAKKSPRES